MSTAARTYDDLYGAQLWAYGRSADAQLMRAVAGLRPGRAVDLGGGQGRHALALAALGFEVEVVDSCETALGQLSTAARAEGLRLTTARANIAFYRPPPGIQLAIGALIFHVPAHHASLQAARAVGEALNPDGLFYVSVPGFTKQTRALACDVLAEAGSEVQWCLNHVVTPEERPQLAVPRRNETRALGIRR